MGNQEIKGAMARVLDPTFQKSQQVRDTFSNNALNRTNDNDILAGFFAVLDMSELGPTSERHLSEKMRACFPHHSSISFDQAPEADRFGHAARQLWQTGYTSWRHNLTELQGDGPQQLQVGQNRAAAAFEYHFYARCLMACANFLLRFQSQDGGAARSLVTYTQETFEQGSEEFGLEATANSIFLGLLNGLAGSLAAANSSADVLRVVSAVLEATQGVGECALFSYEKEGLARDLVFKRIREFLVTFLEGNSPREVKVKSCELLLRLGLITGCAENLVLAAQFQFEFKIDISRHLSHFFNKSDQFIEPSADELDGSVSARFGHGDKKRVQNRCTFNSGTDRQEAGDKFACDGQSYFTWSPSRGLARSKRAAASGEWQHEGEEGGRPRQVQNEAEDVKVAYATFLVFRDKLYLRNKDCTAEPFKLLNKADMKFDTQAPAVTFADAETRRRFLWTHAEDNPPMEIGGNKRWMGVAPMASDGVHVYTLVYHYEDTVDHEKRKALYLEVYLLEPEANQLRFVREQQLFCGEDPEPWIGRKNRGDGADGGYLNYGYLACNGQHLVWSSRHNYHVFAVATGLRARKEGMFGKGGSAHLTCFEPISAKWYGQDAAVYSWLEEYEINGFSAAALGEDEEAEVGLPPLTFELDPIKTKIKNNLHKVQPPKRQADLFAQLVGGALEATVTRQSKLEYDENLARAVAKAEEERQAAAEEDKQDLTADDWIYDWTRAILYAHVSKSAQAANFLARGTSKQLDGAKMLQFAKTAYGISVSESMFRALRRSITELLKDYETHTADASERHALLNLLHIYIAHIGCLRPLHLAIREILTAEEVEAQQALLGQLEAINLFPRQKAKPAEGEEVPLPELFQLHIYHLKRQLCEEVVDLVSTQTTEDRLNGLIGGLRGLRGQEESKQLMGTLRRYHVGELAALFDQGPAEIALLKTVMDETGSLLAERLRKRIDAMVAAAGSANDPPQGYGSEETLVLSEFASTFLQELMVTYCLQSKIILDNELPEKPEDVPEELKRKEDTMRKNAREAKAKRDGLTHMLFESMISICGSVKELCEHLGRKLYTLELTGWSDEDRRALFKGLDFIMTGKFSLLRCVALFVLMTQLYDISTTDLDEVHIALSTAVSGLNQCLAAGETLSSQREELRAAHDRLHQNLKFFQRLLAFGDSKVAARLVHSESRVDRKLEKFEVLRRGISDKRIPALSAKCKEEIEGSFKIVQNEELRRRALPGASDAPGDDGRFLEGFMADRPDAHIARFLELIQHHVAQLASDTASSAGGAEENDEEIAEAKATLAAQAFAIMVHFQGGIGDLRAAVDHVRGDESVQKLSDIPEQHLLPLQSAWASARGVRRWLRQTRQKTHERIRKEVTDAFRKQWADDNPSSPKIERFTDEQQAEIDRRAELKAATALRDATADASAKLHFLRLFEATPAKPNVSTDGIAPELRAWADWTERVPHPDLERERVELVQRADAEEREEQNRKIQEDVLGIIGAEETAKQLQDFVEGLMVRGLRRAAGLHIFNQTLATSSDDVFYDALHLLEASLRQRSARLAHCLGGVRGCGGGVEQLIRDEFGGTIKLVSERLPVETDRQRLVHLLNALLWDYEMVDMQALARARTFEALSGCAGEVGDAHFQIRPEQLFNPLRAAWGREQSFYSLGNLDRSVSDMETREYSLPARLRQTFDHLTAKVYQFTFRDTAIHRDPRLKDVFTSLLQQVSGVLFQKLSQCLSVAAANEVKAAAERDEYIRFDGHSDSSGGERPVDQDVLMADQYLACPGRPAAAVRKKLRENRERKQRAVEKFIIAYMQGEAPLPSSLHDWLVSRLDGADEARLREAIIKREWRAFDALMLSAGALRAACQLPAEDDDELDLPEADNQEEAAAEQEEVKSAAGEEEKKELTDAQKLEEINNKPTDEEKAGAWLAYMRQVTGEKGGITQTTSFSRVTTSRVLASIALMMSLAESNRYASTMPATALKPAHLALLVRLSVHGPTSAQALVQRVFQSLLRIQLPQAALDAAASRAKAEDTTTRVGQILALARPCLALGSPFWQLLLNQIQLAKRAQYSPALQVEVGKAVVVEEITRTFLTVQALRGASPGETIQGQLQQALSAIDEKPEDAVATVFSLVPEAHMPAICTGQRCRMQKERNRASAGELDEQGNPKKADGSEHFVVLGFKDQQAALSHQTKLSMVPARRSHVVGLVLQAGRQVQKSYPLRNITAAPGAGEDTLDKQARARLQKAMATTSVFMNPDTLRKLLDVMTQQSSILRGKPEKAKALSFLQASVTKGIYTMLANFRKQYMTILRSFGMLETLINFLSAAATVAAVSPEEPLVATNLLAVQAAEVNMAAHHMALSTGFYTAFVLFADEKGAFLLRQAEERSHSEFMDIQTLATHGERAPRSACGEGHALAACFLSAGDMARERDARRCAKCREDIHAVEKSAQLKTGFMRCPECSSDTEFCNDCRPKLQVQTKGGLSIGVHSPGPFRLARHEAVMIKSEELGPLSMRALATLRMANVIVTDRNAEVPLPDLLARLNAKIKEDITWKECADIRIIEVDQATYARMAGFIAGAPLPAGGRGAALTALYHSVEYVQKKIESDDNLRLITRFLEPNYNEETFMSQDIPRIVRDEVLREYAEDERQRAAVTDEVVQQLEAMQQGEGVASQESRRLKAAAPGRSKLSDKAPDFMRAFNEGSNKLVKDSGRSMFNPTQPDSEAQDFELRFDELVFQTDEQRPETVHRAQLNSYTDKLNQLTARAIWLFLLAQVNNADGETRQSINLTGKHAKICDLIHDSNMAASHQALFFGNPSVQRRVREQISDVLKYFEGLEGEGQKFRSFFYQDFLGRADRTIAAVRKDGYVDLQAYNLRDLRKVSKLPDVLDPSNLLFLSQQMFERRNFLQESQRAQMAKVMFDLHLGFAILFKSDEDVAVSLQLIKGCAWALDELKANITDFAENAEAVESLFAADTEATLPKIFAYMAEQPETTDKKRLMSEVLIKLSAVHQEVRRITAVNYPKPFAESDSVRTMIRGARALEDGSNFSGQLARLRLTELMKGDQSHQVYNMGQSYRTDEKMFTTYFRKEDVAREDLVITVDRITTNKVIAIKNLGAKRTVTVDRAALRKGTPNFLRVNKGDQYEITFPVAPLEVFHAGRVGIRNQNDELKHTDYTELGEVAIAAKFVRARHHHVMFVAADGEVMGYGYRTQGRGEGQHKFRTIDRPEDSIRQAIVEAKAGKFFRLLLTEEGRVLFSGQNKRFCAGRSLELNAGVEKFHDITANFPVEADDKIIGCDGGKHFSVVVTLKGKVYATGEQFAGAFNSSLRSNAEDSPAYPFEIQCPEGYKAERVWACDRFLNIWVTASKAGEEGKKTFSLGGDYDMAACADQEGAPNWRQPKITEGRWFEELATEGQYALALDNTGALWEWGYHKQSNSDGEPFYVDHVGNGRNSTAVELVWFKRNNKKILKFRCGFAFAMILAEGEGGTRELYGLAGSPSDNDAFGSDYRAVYGSSFVLIKQFSSPHTEKELVDFDCGRQATFVITKRRLGLPPSVMPEKPDARDLVHFWQDGDGAWKFATADDVATGAAEPPDICFATRHPIKDFLQAREDASCLPDLRRLPRNQAARKGQFTDEFKNPYSGETMHGLAGESLYYAKTTFNGQPQVIATTFREARKGGQQFDLNPLVFYALKSPCVELAALPDLDISKLFAPATPDAPADSSDMLSFSITQADLKAEDVLAIPVTDQVSADMLASVVAFTPRQDAELLRAIDSYCRYTLNSVAAKDLLATQIEAKELPISRVSPLRRDTPSHTLGHRAALLAEFSRGVAQILPTAYFEETRRDGSIQRTVEANAHLLLPAVRHGLYGDNVSKYFKERGEDAEVQFSYDRRRAWEFWRLGMKGNKDFITESTFGQLYQKLLMRDTDFAALGSTADRFVYADWERIEEAEDDHTTDFGTALRILEQELTSDLVPLLIRTPNGRLKMGASRDCWVLNPRARADWRGCYQLIGSFLARASAVRDFRFSVAFAPTFWKLLLGEEPTLEDFAKEDARLQKRLDKFKEGLRPDVIALWPADEEWSYTDLYDVVRAVDPERSISARVTKEDLPAFEEALRRKLIAETATQMQHVKQGLETTLGEAHYMTRFLSGHDMMSLCEGAEGKRVAYENTDRIKRLVKYVDCQRDADPHREHLDRFWEIFTGFNYPEKRSLFELWTGRTRLAEEGHRLVKEELRIRIDPAMDSAQIPRSRPDEHELILPASYESVEQFTEKLLAAMEQGCGLDPPAE